MCAFATLKADTPRRCDSPRLAFTGSVLSVHSDQPSADPALPITAGVREEEAVALLRLFYAQVTPGRAEKNISLKERAAFPAAFPLAPPSVSSVSNCGHPHGTPCSQS